VGDLLAVLLIVAAVVIFWLAFSDNYGAVWIALGMPMTAKK
jgi:hypothetical protein